jgi:hypothetical protein
MTCLTQGTRKPSGEHAYGSRKPSGEHAYGSRKPSGEHAYGSRKPSDPEQLLRLAQNAQLKTASTNSNRNLTTQLNHLGAQTTPILEHAMANLEEYRRIPSLARLPRPRKNVKNIEIRKKRKKARKKIIFTVVLA